MYYYNLDQIPELLPNPAAYERQRHFEATSGLPWSLTLGEMKNRYGGVHTWREFQDVVYMPEDAAVLGFGSVRFNHPYSPSSEDWPCSRFHGHFFDLGNHRKNHEAVIAHLTRLLECKPEREDVSNCLGANWNFGLFQIQLHSFIPEENKRFSSNNQLYTSYPELWEATGIAIEARACGYREPDPTLPAAIASNGFEIRTPKTRISNGHFLYNRLLPEFRPKPAPYRLWCDPERLGISNGSIAVAVPRKLVTGLVLHETEPGRSGASCMLSLQTTGISRDEIDLLVHDGDMTALRDVAADTAKLFRLPMVTKQHEGDC